MLDGNCIGDKMIGLEKKIKEIVDFNSLVDYLRDELGWPLDADDYEDLTFDYEPDELGIDDSVAVKIREIKELRKFTHDQPWGVFYIDFEPKRLPVVVLRRILRCLVPKKRSSADHTAIPTWLCNDLLFISSCGESHSRTISFAHFSDKKNGQSVLETFSWDSQETHFHYLENIHLENLQFPKDPSDHNAWKDQWASAFTHEHRYVIRTAKDLSHELALLADRTRKCVADVYHFEKKNGPMHNLHDVFKKLLIHDQTLDDFTDMIAQTIAYGLFSARAFQNKILSTEHLKEMIPPTNPFLRELMGILCELQGVGNHNLDFNELGISEIVQMLNEVNIDAILHDFGRTSKGGIEDPVIHFYESFLKEYDAKKKIERGVFYTPKPVVSYIVQSVHESLKKDFGLELGLADTTTWQEWYERQGKKRIPKHIDGNEPFVQILDPATGTGTFLETVIHVVAHEMKRKWEREGNKKDEINRLWNEYVPKHLLPRLNGFELMMAPYAVAHMKLGLALSETGYDFNINTPRLRVFLTNTLEEAHEYRETLFANLVAEEVNEASKVKADKPITIIIGNPPYSGESKNKGAWIMKLMEDYKREPGGIEKLNERNPKWINDDYVKFLRMGQYFINKHNFGILSYINPHGFLDNPTFRGMRWDLLKTYDYIYLMDLHGNAKKKEKCPDGSKDDNVFDIMQGVAINLLIKTNKTQGKRISKVYHYDLFGKREDKYHFLWRANIDKVHWSKLLNAEPNYFFVNKDFDSQKTYDLGFSVTKLFESNTVGIVTSRDHFVIANNKKDLKNRIQDFFTRDKEYIEKKYKLKENKRFNINKVKDAINYSENAIQQVSYRPFDEKYIYYESHFIERQRKKIMNNFLKNENLGLALCRQFKTGDQYVHCFISDKIIESCYVSNRTSEITSIFPIYKYNENLFSEKKFKSNFNKSIIENLKKILYLDFGHENHLAKDKFTAIDLLDYIYSVLYSPKYRKAYKEFLKIDFPNIPYPKNKKFFFDMVELGRALRELHLLKSPLLKQMITNFVGTGNNQITRNFTKNSIGWEFTNETELMGRVWVNSSQFFNKISLAAWNFYIGGYQPAQKWLKDRKGSSLSTDDIKHYQKIIVALTETINIMQQIDELIEENGGISEAFLTDF